MQSHTRGVITKIISRSQDVFIFAIKTLERNPTHIKVKRFRREIAPEVFKGQCALFQEQCRVALTATIQMEVAMWEGQPVKTTADRPVYQPVLVAQVVDLIAASIEDEIPARQASASTQEAPRQPAHPAPVSPAPVAVQEPAPQAEPGHPAFAPMDDDYVPSIPID